MTIGPLKISIIRSSYEELIGTKVKYAMATTMSGTATTGPLPQHAVHAALSIERTTLVNHFQS
jgi:hypothetical protein